MTESERLKKENEQLKAELARIDRVVDAITKGQVKTEDQYDNGPVGRVYTPTTFSCRD